MQLSCRSLTRVGVLSICLLQSALIARSPRDFWKQPKEQTHWEHKRDVLAVTFSVDSGHAMAISSDGELKKWDAVQSIAKTTIDMRARFVAAAFSENGMLALARPLDEGASVRVVNPNGKEIAQTHSNATSISVMVFSTDGKFVIVGTEGGAIRLSSSNSGKEVATLVNKGSSITSFAIRRDGKSLLSGNAIGQVVLWNLQKRNRLATFQTSNLSVGAVAFSNDGATIAAGGEDGIVSLWGVQRRKLTERQKLHRGAITALAFTNQGDLLSSSTDCTARLSSNQKLALITEFPCNTTPATSLGVAADGRSFIFGGGHFATLWTRPK